MLFKKELAVARDAARKAGEIQLARQSETVQTELKSDFSPVTEVDKQCEALIQKKLCNAFPQDGFFGEETGIDEGASGRRWIVDPLDGTRPYLRGIPTYSTLIALEINNEYVLGVIHFPARGETYWAARGSGAFCNNKPIHVSQTDEISQVMGSCLGIVEEAETEAGRKLLSFMREWNYAYGFMDALSYMYCASGKLDVCISLIDKPWDRAAAACIVTEAGGTYSDLSGKHTIHSSSFAVSNGRFHSDIITRFSTL